MSTQPLGNYNTIPAIPPPVRPHDHEVWLEVCEKLGHSPVEWQTYHRPAFDMEGYHRLMEEKEAERVAIRAEYETAQAWILAVIRFAPDPIREALEISEWRGQCNCECCND